MKLGGKIRELREAQGLSQEDLAHEAGTTTRTVSRIETGTTPSPHPVTLQRLATALGVDRDFFIQGTGRDRRKNIRAHLDRAAMLMTRKDAA